MVYDNSLYNQHRSIPKFTKWWFEPYVMTSANDNMTHHLAELDGTRVLMIGTYGGRHERGIWGYGEERIWAKSGCLDAIM